MFFNRRLCIVLEKIKFPYCGCSFKYIAFSSLFFVVKLVLFPDVTIIACGIVPSILGKHYAKSCENVVR